MRTDNLSAEKDEVSVTIEIQAHVRRLAYPSEPGESVKSCIRRVARATGFSFGEVRRLWYGERRVIPAQIADRLRQAADKHEREIHQQIERQRERLNQLYALANHSADPEFYRKAIAQAVGRTDGDE